MVFPETPIPSAPARFTENAPVPLLYEIPVPPETAALTLASV
jgi:hypothetical protein